MARQKRIHKHYTYTMNCKKKMCTYVEDKRKYVRLSSGVFNLNSL